MPTDVSGKVRRAKVVLAERENDDLSAVNAIGIAVHNLVASLRQMRSLFGELGASNSLTPSSAAEKCLHARVSIYRQASAQGCLSGTPFARHSLFILNIGVASRQPDGRSLIFMEDSWSRCPAAGWVPAMLQGIWNRRRRAAFRFPLRFWLSLFLRALDFVMVSPPRITRFC